MANPEHLAKLKEGVEAWNQWRREHPRVRPDLSGVDLRRRVLRAANLSRAELSNADLGRTNLNGAHLVEASFSDASFFMTELRGADLRLANFIRSNLRFVDLTDANLGGADLFQANISSSNLTGTDFSGAKLWHTAFTDVDLSGVKGLETIFHNGPSAIDIDAIYKSKGKIPHSFLRGAGVSENFITYMPSLVGTGIEFYSLFISYSTHDQEFTERLHADLQAKGVRCWFAPHDVQGGKKLHKQIDEAIRLYDKLLLILSPASMESEWVKTEISKARKREVRECKRVLFPIRLCSFEALRDWECFDADTGKDSAREIREYFIPDFSNWKDHDSYQTAFNKLLEDLHGKPDPPVV
jgi:uncharacterized protein YjbI with pentapeptide repeats